VLGKAGRTGLCRAAEGHRSRLDQEPRGVGAAAGAVTRTDENDTMSLKAECASPGVALREQVTATLRAVAKLGGTVELVSIGSLPNDGKVIADER